MQKTSPRFDILAAAKGWSPVNGYKADGSPRLTMDVEKIFGENTFGLAEMRSRLPKPVFKALMATIEQGTELDPDGDGCRALAMKEWALEKGATHFTHWFQPLTGIHGREARLVHHAERGRRRGDRVLGQGAGAG
jgi:glutamine synthetase